MIFRAMILSNGETLFPQDFPQITGLAPSLSDSSASAAPKFDSASLTKSRETLRPTPSEVDKAVHLLDREGHLRSLEDVERDLIQFAIENYSGHMSEIARRLGIGRSTLYRKVREHALDVDDVRSA